ncbi:beta-lactamase domain protein [Sulfurimonas gotlandica GD1]|uniref:Beta-lactamase domain protein n=1 Tax=Sulfurimonas gotlandica (strain DSM 19862 / JCM 16533 / GD1) TaxID=929558 RepID=B6BLN1_SULGG|nr:MBL fold metallo-hydrolase [Sulfurimonas gotlandica]EDZ62010.1 metallo-beta-lactamase family protein [Sulfurimonas gotlandica GD1]EHP28689.1 beta-lactamase domain protein [Sulfurimonas gotlandica GD1]
MQIKVQPMGVYQTNCYIASLDGKDFIIDPGVNATSWVEQNVTNPVAILNTHGHFDHVWSNAELQKKLNIPLYTPKDDVMLLKESSWMPDLPPSTPDFEVKPDEEFNFDGVKVKFHHFPGHCPGCSMIEIGDAMFSGDFIFERSIGRTDFPYSSPQDMKDSLERFKKLDFDKTLYPGHGGTTTIKQEQQYSDYWIGNL